MSSTLMRATRPLIHGSTYRAALHLLLGGVLLLPHLGLAVLFVRSFRTDPEAYAGLAVLAILAVVVSAAIALVPQVRVLEIAAARALLEVALTEQTVEGSRAWEARRRAAGWYVLNLALGGATVLTVLFVLPSAAGLAVAPLTGLEPVQLGGVVLRAEPGRDAWWPPLVALALLVALGYLLAAGGTLLRALAPVLLGPSPAEQIAEAERRADRLAERNRLARELHDSVGHALTATTLQAGAARQVLDTDPEFARRALAAIEDTGRAALDDLDHVLGLLRDERRDTAPRRTLDDLDALIAEAGATGVPVHLDRRGSTASVPAVVSREAYRIVQEGVTNTLRHAGRVPLSLRLQVDPTGLDLEMTNPLGEGGDEGGDDGGTDGRTGGRGLQGIRERVGVLRGTMTAGAQDGRWTMTVRLPLRSAP